jgi:chemotaxis protein CheD
MSVTTPKNIDILLQAGEVYFGKAPTTIKTLLGSCVAITVWHPSNKRGGICHYLLTKKESMSAIGGPNYRYAQPALDYLYNNMTQYAPASEYEVCLFGGSNMYTHRSSPTIGESNIIFAKNWLETKQITAKKSDILGNICRTISFDLSDGKIILQRYQHES